MIKENIIKENEENCSELQSLNGQKNVNENVSKKDKWYTKFKGIFYCMLSSSLIAMSSILIKKCILFNAFEQSVVINFINTFINE
jgi:hypothetical protein